MIILLDLEDYWDRGVGPTGQAHAVSSEPEEGDEAVRLLHEAVKTVTGKAVEPAARPRMGFLP